MACSQEVGSWKGGCILLVLEKRIHLSLFLYKLYKACRTYRDKNASNEIYLRLK